LSPNMFKLLYQGLSESVPNILDNKPSFFSFESI
jgi:hypothetical protein